MAAVEPTLPPGVATTLGDRITTVFARESLIAHLLTGVRAAGVLLALFGLVAVVHQQVQRRRRFDIAVPLALGATATAVDPAEALRS